MCKFESHVQVKVPWGHSVVVSPSFIGNVGVSWGLIVQEVTGSEVQMDPFEASSVVYNSTTYSPSMRELMM